jgi:glucokinase
MRQNNNTLLCDIGGTHARFARLRDKGRYADFKKYRLNEFERFEDIVQNYIDDTGLAFNEARFAAAKTVVNGVISYKRTSIDPDYDINFPALQSHFKWEKLLQLDDMVPAMAGALYLNAERRGDLNIVVPSSSDQWNDHKIVMSIGTGLGLSHAMNGVPFVTPGGHFLPLTVTQEQREIESFIRKNKNPELSLIMEDFVSLGGLRMIDAYYTGHIDTKSGADDFMLSLKSRPDVPRLFFEFLGLAAHMVVGATGFYGGLFLTGGVLDHLVRAGIAHWDAFEAYFRVPLIPVMNDRFNSVPVHYVLHDELPLLGLTTFD